MQRSTFGGYLRVITIAATFLFVVYGGNALANPILPFTISLDSTGCFTAPCTTTSPAVQNVITFAGVSGLGINIDASGSAILSNLGTFFRTNGNYTGGDTTFTLGLNFGIGPGSSVALFNANLLAGQNPNSAVHIIFDNVNVFQTYYFSNALGSGSFDFAITTPKTGLGKEESFSVTGVIRNFKFNQVPEPSTLLLIGSGVLLVGIRACRRG